MAGTLSGIAKRKTVHEARAEMEDIDMFYDSSEYIETVRSVCGGFKFIG